MSYDTARDIGSAKILSKHDALEDLEYVVTFESFPHKKTGVNIGEWLMKSHEKAGLLPQFVMHHATDGASNARLSSTQYAEMTNHLRDNTMTFSTCSAHQIHRAALYASGDPSFKYPQNEELHTALAKLHGIFERIRRSPQRTKILDEVQNAANR